MQNERILVVDDEPIVCKSCLKILNDLGYEVETVQSGQEALERVEKEPFDIVIVDLKMPGISGMEVLKTIRETYPDIIVIMITGYSTVETAVEAMKLGAFDYIPKPFTPDELSIRIEKALERKNLLRENRYLRQELQAKYEFGNIIGKSKPMQEIYRIVKKVAPTDSTVLIHGESGTGKELIARAIHHNSPRREKPFIAVDCGALSEDLLESELFGHVKGSFTGAIVNKPGLFEVANGGTFFLDEIGDISLGIQAKLLRVLQEKEFKQVGGIKTIKVNVRLIAATNKNIEKMISEGKFREDLFYRLNIVPIFLPPLRKRKDDIPLLAHHFLTKYNRERNKNIKNISPEAMNLLTEYNWPGNVRELENVIERVIVMTDEDIIRPEHLPPNIQRNKVCIDITTPKNNIELKRLKKQAKEQAIERIEKSFVIEALKRNNWNVTKSAIDVGMKRQNF
ncbi:MAG TPA: sigma-54-dependent Fis family transcriptional regulator, partial [bacterium (Candidatus Stahlbacteria)]|nr:sigma-54-dependent Fis family transcriptional regulator [Candidatus Stahlbacteria bacterium]